MSPCNTENIQTEGSRLTQNQIDLLEGLQELDQLLTVTLPEIQDDPVDGHVYQNERLVRSLNTARSVLLRKFSKTLKPDKAERNEELPQPYESGEGGEEELLDQTLSGDAFYDLWNIIAGINPITGEPLHEDHPFQNPALLRGLKAALSALSRQIASRNKGGVMSQSGHGWSEEEIEDLLEEYDSGTPILSIAQKHRRSCLSIMIQIKRYREVRPDLWGAYGR